MFNIERWQEIFEAIAKNKLRTFLTGLSQELAAMREALFGKGLQNGIEKQFERDAAGIIEVWSGATTKAYKGLNPGREIQFRNSDYDISVQKFGEQFDKKGSSYNAWGASVVYGKESGNYQYRGVNPDYGAIENATIIKGRFINANDLINNEKVAVIGQKINLDLFKGNNPIGEKISINNINFKVVGVFTDPGGEREEGRVFIPLSTAQQVYGIGDKISNMFYTLKKKNSYEEAVAEAEKFSNELESVLKNKNSVNPEDKNAIGIFNSVVEAKKFYDLNLYIRLFFWWVGICTIIAGVVGVSNIMMIIVKERTKEIGIRKALGASPISIIVMILHESIFITMISGFLGLLTGLSLLELIGPHAESEYFRNPQVDFTVAISTLIVLVIAGALAGFIPAYRAAKIKPIVALRDE